MAQGQNFMNETRLRVLAEIDGLTVGGCTREEWEAEIPVLVANGLITPGLSVTELGDSYLVGVMFPMGGA